MYTTRPANATSSTAARKVWREPDRLDHYVGAAAVRHSSRVSCRSSLLVLMLCAAPALRAVSSLASSRSTPITVAPRNAAPATAPSPTPPQPNTRPPSSSASRARERLHENLPSAAQPCTALSMTRLARNNFCAGTAMNSVSAPSRCTPSVWLNWHALGRWRRHAAHGRSSCKATRSPLFLAAIRSTSDSVPPPSRRSRARECAETKSADCARDRNSDRSRTGRSSHLEQNLSSLSMRGSAPNQLALSRPFQLQQPSSLSPCRGIARRIDA